MNASTQPMIAFDEFGRPFVILRDQSTKKRLAGLEAQKVATSWSKTEELTDLSSSLSHPVIRSTLVPMICCKICATSCRCVSFAFHAKSTAPDSSQMYPCYNIHACMQAVH